MHSIRTKVTSLTIAAVLLSVALIGTMAILITKDDSEQRSAQLMELLCEAKTDEINSYLTSIEDATQTVSRYAYDSLDVAALYRGGVIGALGSGEESVVADRTTEQRESLDKYLRSYLDNTLAVFRTIADSNPMILSYYFRLNPEISAKTEGYWYSRRGSSFFVKQRNVDVTRYDADDTGHVGWYYQPLQRGVPSWLDPYHSGIMDEDVVSYVMPLYRFGTFVGVIGVDASYSSLVDLIDGIEVLKTGYAFLTDDEGRIVYHPGLKMGTMLSDVNWELESSNDLDNGAGTLSYKFGETERKAVWGSLTNGLRLIVSAPAQEINEAWNRLAVLIVVATIFTMAVFAWAARALMRRITEPLETLANASEQLAEGNYNVELTYNGDDEVGTLTRSFAYMKDELRELIEDLNSRAYRDALTGVRNKGSFNLLAHKLDEIITYADTGHVPDFAIVMFDCNGLKHVNDTYGHEKGDVYLCKACDLICQVFSHSPVYRLGGDEFCVLLQQHDLRDYEALASTFDERVKATNEAAQNEWETIDIARGVAVYDPSVDNDIESVMRRADLAMYDDKHRMRAERE
jgi:diguanylate cyclase (GGDEF)-like protein